MEALLKITGHESLLDDSPVLQRSIRLRNPYVDPLSYVQVSLLRRLRALPEDSPKRQTTLNTCSPSASHPDGTQRAGTVRVRVARTAPATQDLTAAEEPHVASAHGRSRRTWSTVSIIGSVARGTLPAMLEEYSKSAATTPAVSSRESGHKRCERATP